MAGNEAEEMTSMIISSMTKTMQSALDLLLQLLRGATDIASDRFRNRGQSRSGVDDGKRHGLGRATGFIADHMKGHGEKGEISARKLNEERAGETATTLVDRADLAEMRKNLLKRGVDFAVKERSDGKFEFMYKAKNANVIAAVAEEVALKMGATKQQVEEAKDREEISAEGIYGQYNAAGLDRKGLPAPKETMEYANQTWTLADVEGQTTYISHYDGLQMSACADGTYTVSDSKSNEVFSGKSFGDLKSAMLDASVGARSFAKQDELNKGIKRTTVTKAQMKAAVAEFKNTSLDKKDELVDKTKEAVNNNKVVQQGKNIAGNVGNKVKETASSVQNKGGEFKKFLENKKAKQQAAKIQRQKVKNKKRNNKFVKAKERMKDAQRITAERNAKIQSQKSTKKSKGSR